MKKKKKESKLEQCYSTQTYVKIWNSAWVERKDTKVLERPMFTAQLRRKDKGTDLTSFFLIAIKYVQKTLEKNSKVFKETKWYKEWLFNLRWVFSDFQRDHYTALCNGRKCSFVLKRVEEKEKRQILKEKYGVR